MVQYVIKSFATLLSYTIFHSLPSFLSCIEIVFGVIPSGKSDMYKAKPRTIIRSIKYIPGQTVVHFARSTWDPSHMGPPHLGVGLSHLRSLLWYPWPHFELHWLHSDQLDQPPLTGKSNLSNSIGIQKIVGDMPKNLLWIVGIPLFVLPSAAVAKSPCKQLHSRDLITCYPRLQWVPKDRVFIDF